MIEIIGGIISVFGLIMMVSSMLFCDNDFFKENSKLCYALLTIGTIMLFVGVGIVAVSSSQCRLKCDGRGLIYNGQEYNQCTKELTCYCKQPVILPEPKVVIIK